MQIRPRSHSAPTPLSSSPPSSSPVPSSAPKVPVGKPTWKRSETGQWTKVDSKSGKAIAVQKKLEDAPTAIEKVRSQVELLGSTTLDKSASQTRALMQAIRENTMSVFDHKQIGKVDLDSSVVDGIKKAKSKIKSPPKFGSDLPRLKSELASKQQALKTLEQTPIPDDPIQRRTLAMNKHTLQKDIKMLSEKIITRESPRAPIQSGHELLRKQAIDPLSTAKALKKVPEQQLQLDRLKTKLNAITKRLGPELLAKVATLPEMEQKYDKMDQLLTAYQSNQNNPKLMKKLGPKGAIKLQKDIAKLAFDMVKLKSEIKELKPIQSMQAQIETLETEIHSAKHDTTWERVKTSHIGGVSSGTKLSMVMALDARLREFKEVSSQIASELGIDIVFPGDPEPTDPDASYLKVTICGSTELSSDIDVNTTPINLPIGKETEFIMAFNLASQATHQDQTGNKYDINIYNAMNSKFPNVKSELARDKSRGGDGLTPVRARVLSPKAQRIDDKNEAIISYLHMDRFMDDTQFGDYQKEYAKVIKTVAPDKLEDLSGRLSSGREISQTSEAAVREKMLELRESGDYDSSNDKELELIASNMLYEEASTRAHELTSLAHTDIEQVQADHAMTKAHYFANEAALTSGVLRATVAKEQIIPGMNRDRAELGLPPVKMLDISLEEYASAGRENIGNVFKELNHHKDDPAPMQLVRASKYFGRANRNYEDLIKASGIELSESGQQALAFLKKLSAAEGFGEDTGLLALRKDKIGGSNPLQVNPDESTDQAKLRHATEIMTKSGLGDFVDNPKGLQSEMIKAYATLDALLSAHISPD